MAHRMTVFLGRYMMEEGLRLIALAVGQKSLSEDTVTFAMLRAEAYFAFIPRFGFRAPLKNMTFCLQHALSSL